MYIDKYPHHAFPCSSKNKLYRFNPKRWITEISRLFKENKLTEAKQELKLFREKHTDHPDEDSLPQALQKTQTNEQDWPSINRFDAKLSASMCADKCELHSV